ncbi:MAG: DsbA family protein [Candidatus Gracilibacteria bacterium]
MKNSKTLLVGLSFLVLGIMIGLSLSSGGRTMMANLVSGNPSAATDSSASQAQGAAPEAEPTGAEIAAQVDPSAMEVMSVSIDDDPILGDSEAPVTIVEFSDFQCPYCAKFVTDSMGKLMENYIDKGIVKIVFRDFPLPSHTKAAVAAQAAECYRSLGAMAKDELYFEMHDMLFANQSVWGQFNDTVDPEAAILKLMESELGEEDGTISRVKSCIDDGSMQAEIEADYKAGREYGISGTPTFFINGKKLVGAYPYEVFAKIIDSLK